MSTAIISIGGAIVSVMDHGYRRWFFNRNDRVIRNPCSGQENIEYLYVTTAEELRDRLDTFGYNRRSLEGEFRQYENKVEHFTNLPYLCDNPKEAFNRAHSVEFATIDDWLGALGAARAKSIYDCDQYTLPRFQKYESSDPFVDIELLSECVTNYDHFDDSPSMLPTHNRTGFPCASLECMAVAMLEVVSDNAECILNVTELVKGGDVYCFDDLIAARSEHALASR
ncbi:HEPN/Toprim-associated domain-containing protein [Paraburkholderia bryophila]|uniref:HEPN/Toprim N-terminal domain-containing protein n=1 Tax=Paraburkholderia bryophila TaxID=420952 RepID=A0A329C7W2_9BURK|nr:HEPN/Toprim-associated domain-containing protein [Paraburkholderia bryophila]RAS29792.1 hypothetical protein BX591_11067 [Paraburkholderia bryophila]